MTIEDLVISDEPLEPETLDQLFPELNPKEREYILTLRVIIHTNLIFEDMDIFENAVQVLNDISPDVFKTEGVKPEWIWNALRLITKLRPDADFSEEVYRYIAFIQKSNDMLFIPDIPGYKRDPYLTTIINLVKDQRKPLPEDKDGIQASRYLKIIEYLKGH